MRTKAFTLIELLIVVAIIAILAAIAVPNFLEAQVRSKVSRSRADMRTLATAVEAYAVDHNGYSTDAGNGTGFPNAIYRPYAPTPTTAVHPMPNYSIGFELTTPIAYLASAAALVDPFKSQLHVPVSSPLWGRHFYNFSSIAFRYKHGATTAATYNIYNQRMGDWCIMGAGPDRAVNNAVLGGGDFSILTIPNGRNYDPTNGTVSVGDIYRSQKFSDRMQENPTTAF